MKNKKLVPDTTPEADVVMTPQWLASAIVKHFSKKISGKLLDPCSGKGAFVRAYRRFGFENYDTCELSKGKDFFDYNKKVDWIITNPPWSKCRNFLRHGYEVSENIVFLITINHILALKARLRDMKNAGFGIQEIVLCDTPKENWPQSGFQLGAVYLKRGKQGNIKWTELKGI